MNLFIIMQKQIINILILISKKIKMKDHILLVYIQIHYIPQQNGEPKFDHDITKYTID